MHEATFEAGTNELMGWRPRLTGAAQVEPSPDKSGNVVSVRAMHKATFEQIIDLTSSANVQCTKQRMKQALTP